MMETMMVLLILITHTGLAGLILTTQVAMAILSTHQALVADSVHMPWILFVQMELMVHHGIKYRLRRNTLYRTIVIADANV
jgi:hypothetical protein